MTQNKPEDETNADPERSIRLHVEIPRHVLAELSQVAAERAVPLEDVLRERIQPEIEQYLARRAQQSPERALPRAFSSPPLFQFSCGIDTIPPKQFIGRSDVRACLFCGRSEAQVSFSVDAHIIPAAFGNRSLFSLEECNDCNHRAGRQLEDHLVRALAPERGLMGLRSRKGHIKHKPRGESGKSYVMSGGRETKIVYHDDDDSIRVERTSPEEFDVHIRGGTYRPMAVAKSLARMALLVLNESARGQIGWLLSWVNGTQTWRPAYAEAFVPGPRPLDYGLAIYETENPALPFAVEFGMGNVKYMMMLPATPTDTAIPGRKGRISTKGRRWSTHTCPCRLGGHGAR